MHFSLYFQNQQLKYQSLRKYIKFEINIFKIICILSNKKMTGQDPIQRLSGIADELSNSNKK